MLTSVVIGAGVVWGLGLDQHLRIHHPELPGHELHLENNAVRDPGANIWSVHGVQGHDGTPCGILGGISLY